MAYNGNNKERMKKTEIAKILEWHNSGKLKTDEAVEQICSLSNVVGKSEQLVCDVCGSNDVIEAPHMGKNCNRCHPL